MKRLLTGSHARDMVEQHDTGSQKMDAERWTIFRLRDDENIQLEKDMQIVYWVNIIFAGGH